MFLPVKVSKRKVHVFIVYGVIVDVFIIVVLRRDWADPIVHIAT
jgi:hypothetical protein